MPLRPAPKPPATAITRVEASYTGPLPPPGMLIQFNDAFPGAAERIVAMTERQSAHRENIETIVVTAAARSQTRGSWFAFIISMTAILGGIYLVKLGKSGEGVAAIITSLAGLAAVFIYGKKKEKKELNEKADVLAKRMNNKS